MEKGASLDLQTVKQRSIRGVATLTFRTFFIQAVNLISTFILTILLSPEVFGIFFVVSAVINFLIYFSDIGLAAALVQKKQKPTRIDLVTTFTIQQVLVITLVGISLLLSPLLASFYHLSSEGIWLFRSLVFAFFLSSLKTIPSVLLERELNFSKLIIPQVVETLVFNFSAILLAWQGMGVVSFAVAVFLRGLSGLVAMYLISPWRMGIGLSKRAAKGLLYYGIPFQTNSLLALVKDDLQTAFLGRVLTLGEIGYLGWAQKWAFMPLRLFMDSVNKVTFPSFSRLQDNLEGLKPGVEKALFVVCASTFPVLVGLAVMARPLVGIIPRYSKWLPAVLPLYLFLVNALFACFSSTLTNVLNATGRVKTTLKLMVMWTGLTWLLVPFLVFRLGYLGAALASAIIAITSVVTVFLARQVVKFELWFPVLIPLFSALLMGAEVFLVTRRWLGISGLMSGFVVGLISYPILLLIFSRGRVWKDVRVLVRVVWKDRDFPRPSV